MTLIITILPGVIKTDLSAHYPLFCSNNTSASFAKKLKPMLQRNLQKFNCQTFCDGLDIAIENFFQSNNDINSNNLSKLFSNFVKVFQDTINFHALYKKLPRKQVKLKLSLGSPKVY